MAPEKEKHNCQECNNSINDRSLKCYMCLKWTHKKCTKISSKNLTRIKKGELIYKCALCPNEPRDKEVRIQGDMSNVNSDQSDSDSEKEETETEGDFEEDYLNSSAETTIEAQVKDGIIKNLLDHVKKLETKLENLSIKVTSLEKTLSTLSKNNSEEPEMNTNNIKNIDVVDLTKPQKIENFSSNVIKMKCGNIFDLPENETIAHCIAKDCLMTEGIAKKIKRKFNVNVELLQSKANVGNAILQNDNGKNIIHLITKEITHYEPHWKDFRTSITSLKKLCVDNNISELHIPKIGTGMDKLHWPKVFRLLNSVFYQTNIDVTVWYLDQKKQNEFKQQINNKRTKIESSNKCNKLYVLGDSHTRDLSIHLNYMTNGNFKSFAQCVPGGTSEFITKNLNGHVTHLEPEDALICFAGTNDIYKSKNGITVLPATEPKKYILSHSLHTNVIIVTVPLRKDNHEINEIIKVYNENLISVVDDFKINCELPERVEILDINSVIKDDMYDNDYYNDIGKNAIAKQILDIYNKFDHVTRFFRT